MFNKLWLILFFTFCSYLNLICIDKDFDLTLIELQKVLNINDCAFVLADHAYGFQVFIYRDANKYNYLMIDIYSKQIKEIQEDNNLYMSTHKFCDLDSTIKEKILNSKIDSVDFVLRYFDEETLQLFIDKDKLKEEK